MIVELLPPNTGRAFEAMRELRTGLVDQNSFVEQVDEVQRPAGYRIAGWVETDDDDAAAVAGSRVGENFAWGRHIYVDDLSTFSADRNQGHAGQLLEWVHEEAARRGCAEVHLDSGVSPDRLSAHRLYLNAGYRISSHHFVCPVRQQRAQRLQWLGGRPPCSRSMMLSTLASRVFSVPSTAPN